MKDRHRALYDYLLAKGDNYTLQHQVASDLYEHYGNGECYFELKQYHNTAERCHLSQDIADINISPEFEKIIISSPKGIKLANEAEFFRYIENQRKSTLRKLSRIYKMAKKGGLHNQMDFGGHIVESFLENLPETP